MDPGTLGASAQVVGAVAIVCAVHDWFCAPTDDTFTLSVGVAFSTAATLACVRALVATLFFAGARRLSRAASLLERDWGSED